MGDYYTTILTTPCQAYPSTQYVCAKYVYVYAKIYIA